MKLLPFCAVVLFLLPVSGFSSGEHSGDLPGSGDHPALKRMEGSVIVAFEKKKFDEQCLALERVVFDYTAQKIRPFKHEMVEGEQWRILYRAPLNASSLEVFRQYQTALKADGFETLFEGKGGDENESTIDNGYDRFLQEVFKAHGLPEPIYTALSLNRDSRYGAFRKFGASGNTTVSVFVAANKEWPDAFGTAKGQALALVTVTEEKSMTDRMVVVKAAEMSSAIEKTGRIALYGIYFDTDQAAIKPESDATLAEMAALLREAPDRKFLIVGHTDNQGAYEYNVALSKRRAEAVVAALASRHNIPRGQILPVGVGMAAPVAPNTDEAGRAKNRRVEIVAM